MPIIPIPQGFTDAVNAAFVLKLQADASASAQTDAQAEVAKAQALLDAATNTAKSDSQALNQGRIQLEALLDAYLTVGGTLPTETAPPA